MRRTIMTAFATGALVLASGTVAVAGEYNGKGDPVPGGVKGASLCSFSGQDLPDEDEGDHNHPDDHITIHGAQSYGQTLSVGGVNLKGTPFHPGKACNPNIGLSGEG